MTVSSLTTLISSMFMFSKVGALGHPLCWTRLSTNNCLWKMVGLHCTYNFIRKRTSIWNMYGELVFFLIFFFFIFQFLWKIKGALNLRKVTTLIQINLIILFLMGLQKSLRKIKKVKTDEKAVVVSSNLLQHIHDIWDKDVQDTFIR